MTIVVKLICYAVDYQNDEKLQFLRKLKLHAVCSLIILFRYAAWRTLH